MELRLVLQIALCLLVLATVTNALPRRNPSVSIDIFPGLLGNRYITIKKDGTTVVTGCLDHNSHTHLSIERDGSCTHFSQTAETASDVLEHCFDLGDAHWFGGPEQFYQYWPVEKDMFADYSYVTKQQDNQGIAEPYWLNSDGVYFHVDDGVPLFIDLNNGNKSLCFKAKNAAPYPPTTIPFLNYSICTYADAREAHEHAIQTVLGKPTGYPDERMIKHPIWSTWARYKKDVNESVVLAFAEEIVSNGFNNSQLEIDDDWEVCYGALTFRESKFPNMKNLTDTLKAMGFRVTLWVHPFINLDCEPWHSEALEKGYFVKNLDGSVNSSWWNGAGSVIDFTNPEAAEWYVNRLKQLQEENGIDSFKFDAGETSWLPQLPVLNATDIQNPSIYTTSYVNTVSQFGPMIEVRVGQRSQNLPIFVRMLDKDTRWNWNNGLKTLVSTLLVMNMVGYPLVLPDMIGGNGYGDIVTKELFIRWLQVNVFMPSLQYSYVPWDFDDETIAICKKFTDLHAQYADKIIELAAKATVDGSPINPPIWWVDPTDEEALAMNTEFLLGEDILVAPILDIYTVSRDIYLPKGQWRDELRSETVTGPITLSNYSVGLDELAYFTRVSA
ncbi:myogenesis-regulating glycosidase-like [Periplaneta americana]|uniref:myogenesis-regulating glycosidase-like n=1 Tax=Periplaneta americana TaxID=6978 RepID=UPI0037E8E543